jgi:hypothetical protein
MQSILERLINKVNEANIDPAPSDNIYMQDVFSPSVYNDILTRLPRDENYLFIDHPDAILPDGTKTRKLLDLTEETIQHLNPEDQDFWRQIYAALISSELQESIVSKFAPRIKERFGGYIPEMVSVPIFYRDYPGYRIGVHTDAPYKIATLQFYFPEDESQLHLGTTFHQRLGNYFMDLKTNIFKPNSAYAFVRTDNSWHSVKQLATHEKKRNTLALTIYLKGHEYKSSSKEYK